MLKINNPFKKESDEQEEMSVQLKDVLALCESIGKAIGKNVDATLPLHFHWFNMLAKSGEALNIWLEKRNQALKNHDDVVKMLREDSFYEEAAAIADDVYEKNEGALPGGWHRTKEFDYLNLEDKVTGLNSFVYVRETSDGKEYVYANAGTNPKDVKDWQANVDQVIGESAQYKQAAQIALRLSETLNERNEKLTFVGHSLGGGIATNNALITRHKAVVFNPAGLSGKTLSELNPESLNNEYVEQFVTAFVATNDILNWSQDVFNYSCRNLDESVKKKSLLPRSFGKRIYIYPHEKNPVKSHYMGTMKGKLQELKNA